MSDTHSFDNEMLVDQQSTRRTVGLLGAEDDDGTGISWQVNAEMEAEDQEEEETDDDDDADDCVVVEVKRVVKKKPELPDDEDYSASEADDVDDKPTEKAKPAAKKVTASQPKTAKKPVAKQSKKSKTVTKGAVPKSTRLLWEKTHRELVSRDGVKKFEYPFLEKEGYHLDNLAAMCVASTGAHVAVYGEVKAKWEEATKLCREQVCPDTGVALFETLNHTKLQERFGKWMAFVEWHRAKLDRDSGTDDEISGNQLLDRIDPSIPPYSVAE